MKRRGKGGGKKKREKEEERRTVFLSNCGGIGEEKEERGGKIPFCRTAILLAAVSLMFGRGEGRGRKGKRRINSFSFFVCFGK